MPLLTSDETPINPYRIIRDVMQTVDLETTTVTHDSGIPATSSSPSGSPPCRGDTSVGATPHSSAIRSVWC